MNVLFNAANYTDLLSGIVSTYGFDFDAVRIETQLELFGTKFTVSSTTNEVMQAHSFLQTSQRLLYSEVVTLFELIMVMPKNYFLPLCRIKTYLRSTMRLNHCMLLNVYKEETDKIDLITIAKSFICNERRLTVFGHFD